MRCIRVAVVLLALVVLAGAGAGVGAGADAQAVHSHAHSHSHSHGGDHGHSHEHQPVTRTRPAGTPAPVVGHGEGHGGHGHSHAHGGDGGRRSTSVFTYPEGVVAAGSALVTTLRDLGPWQAAFAATAFISLAPVVLLTLVPVDSRTQPNSLLLKTLVSFAVGGLLGDVFLHLLPHALVPHDHGADTAAGAHGHAHDHEHDHERGIWVGLYVLAGLVTFFVLEKLVRLTSSDPNDCGPSHSHSHSHSHGHAAPVAPAAAASAATPTTTGDNVAAQWAAASSGQPAAEPVVSSLAVAGLLNLAADAAHNFTDGLAIAASFLVSPQMGLSTTIAVFFHEIPHEIGDYAILIQSGFTRRQAMLAQVGTAGGAMLGTLLGLATGEIVDSIDWFIPFTAGGFIYVATVGVLPSLLDKTTWTQTAREIAAIALGVGFMVVIALNE